jgi:hypothetical protein
VAPYSSNPPGSDGMLELYVDGQLEAEIDGPDGDTSYRDGRLTSYSNDPFLVLGAEKNDVGAAFPSFSGWIDEVRLSNVIRYSNNFTPPFQPFNSDSNTIALYHFDERQGDAVNDSSGAVGSPSNGVRSFGGFPAGPVWSSDSPFYSSPGGPADPLPITDSTSGVGCFIALLLVKP